MSTVVSLLSLGADPTIAKGNSERCKDYSSSFPTLLKHVLKLTSDGKPEDSNAELYGEILTDVEAVLESISKPDKAQQIVRRAYGSCAGVSCPSPWVLGLATTRRF